MSQPGPSLNAAVYHSGDPAFDGLQEHFRASFEPALALLLDDALATGQVRDDIEPYDLLRALGNLAIAGEDGKAHTKRMAAVLIDGLSVQGQE